MKFKQIVFGTIGLLFFVSCGKNQKAESEVKTSEYEVITLSPQQAVLHSTYPVTIKGKEDVEIRPRIEGFIDNIYVDEGSVVKKGQLLFKINSPQTEQALTSAQASVNSAKVDVDRIRPLVEKGILSATRLQVVENAYESAMAALKNAEESRRWANVTSPVDGVVGSVSFRQGSLVDRSNVLTTVANTSDVYAYFSLNEKSVMNFLNGMDGTTQSEKIKNMPEVSLLFADGTEYSNPGKIETISGVINVSTGSANFRAKFPNKEGVLRSGLSGKIIIPRTLDEVIVIPQEATFLLQDKVLVFKVKGDAVEQTLVTVESLPNGKQYAVTEGLTPGDVIVAKGVVTLRNGDKIKIKQQ